MNIDAKSLESLAGALVSAGAPILGTIIGGPIGPIIGILLPQIAGAFGLAPDAAPADVEKAVKDAGDAAGDKLAAIEQQHKAAIEWAQLQATANSDEAKSASLFISGWRPAFAWVCIAWVCLSLGWTFTGRDLPGAFLAIWNPVWLAFGGMLGLRSVEKFMGVARDTLKNIPVKRRKLSAM